MPEWMIDDLLALEPRCNWVHHDAGTYGCEPGAPGEYVVSIGTHCAPPPAAPTVLVVCQSQQIRLRGSLDETVQCGLCHVTTTWRDLIRFLGPVAEYNPRDGA